MFCKGLEIVKQAIKLPSAQNSDFYKGIMEIEINVKERIDKLKNNGIENEAVIFNYIFENFF